MFRLQKSFIVFVVLVVFLQTALKVEAGGSVSMVNNLLNLRGNAHIKFLEPQERVWADLSEGIPHTLPCRSANYEELQMIVSSNPCPSLCIASDRCQKNGFFAEKEFFYNVKSWRRFPIIHSGDRIALRVMYSSYSTRWIRCYSSYCYYSTCPGQKVMPSNKWSSCTYEQFYIRGVNKIDGQAILSGDFVTLAPYTRGSTCRLRCFSSTSTKCNSATCVSESYFRGNNAFSYSYLTFQIFSRKAVDGQDPIQYGDTVAFRYPYYYPNHWLYFSGSYLYARSCSYSSKTSCAYKQNYFGFQIFKRL